MLSFRMATFLNACGAQNSQLFSILRSFDKFSLQIRIISCLFASNSLTNLYKYGYSYHLINIKLVEKEMRYLLFLLFIVGLAWSHVINSSSEKNGLKSNEIPRKQETTLLNDLNLGFMCQDYPCSTFCIAHGHRSGNINT